MSSSTSAPDATKDPQTWLFPPPGAPVPPVAATSNFGPVFLGDSMVLNWFPSIAVNVRMTCITTNSTAPWLHDVLGSGLTPPYTYKFSSSVFSAVAMSETYCHYFFDPSSMGNTVVWEVKKEDAPNGRTTTWAGLATSTTTSGSSSATPTTSTTTSADRSSTASPPATQSPGSEPSGGTSNGVKIGVGVGIGVGGFVAIVAFVLFLLRRRQRNATGPTDEADPSPRKEPVVYGSMAAPVHELPGATPAQELEGSKVRQ